MSEFLGTITKEKNPRKKVGCCCFTLALNTYVPFSALWNECILRSHVNTSKTENLVMVLIC